MFLSLTQISVAALRRPLLAACAILSLIASLTALAARALVGPLENCTVHTGEAYSACLVCRDGYYLAPTYNDQHRRCEKLIPGCECDKALSAGWLSCIPQCGMAVTGGKLRCAHSCVVDQCSRNNINGTCDARRVWCVRSADGGSCLACAVENCVACSAPGAREMCAIGHIPPADGSPCVPGGATGIQHNEDGTWGKCAPHCSIDERAASSASAARRTAAVRVRNEEANAWLHGPRQSCPTPSKGARLSVCVCCNVSVQIRTAAAAFPTSCSAAVRGDR